MEIQLRLANDKKKKKEEVLATHHWINQAQFMHEIIPAQQGTPSCSIFKIATNKGTGGTGIGCRTKGEQQQWSRKSCGEQQSDKNEASNN